MSERGRTSIEPRVVERIAARAVTEELRRPARVRARLEGDAATLDVKLTVGYPDSVAEATERTRAHLVRRTGELTGFTVPRVDIVVTGLDAGDRRTRRVR
ncbi:Asp23/Gls24 family envelope stress response protein [Amycolatopsis anabasis]|uniref:Asp23/Gls24 family envelope stress response protein n=1 Tax=Amycolatopsis anabasis TaxID=1840409 RepID=UPI00131E345A|nr:Asp23/Gls24 family envelope stress response protein [Amycolatopsis anabasis]